MTLIKQQTRLKQIEKSMSVTPEQKQDEFDQRVMRQQMDFWEGLSQTKRDRFLSAAEDITRIILSDETVSGTKKNNILSDNMRKKFQALFPPVE